MRSSICRTVGERIALVLDLENLLHGYRAARDWGNAVAAVAGIVGDLGRRGTLVAAIAVCDTSLAAHLSVPLAKLGVRVFRHAGGPDAADLALIDKLDHDVPRSCGTVVIGSGDHIFAGVAARLRRAGKRVEMVSVPGHDSLMLRRTVDRVIRLPEPAFA